MGLDNRTLEADPIWQSSRVDALYHRLCEAPTARLNEALNGYARALRISARFAVDWADTVRQAGQDAAAPRLTLWGERLVRGSEAAQAGQSRGGWHGRQRPVLQRCSTSAAGFAAAPTTSTGHCPI